MPMPQLPAEIQLTREQALTARTLYCVEPDRRKNSKNAYRVSTVRRNGATQIWKTRPAEFSIPVKYGLSDTFRITHRDAKCWTTDHTAVTALCEAMNKEANGGAFKS